MATCSSSGDDSPPAAYDLVLPSYPEMIVEAIASLAEENGSSQAAIARRIEAAHGAGGDLPPSHPALVAAHLSRMSAAAELVAVAGGKYALPPAPDCPADDDSPDDALPPPPPPPAKRGRGRPPKARPPGFPGGAAAPIGAPIDGAAVAAPARPPAQAAGPARAAEDPAPARAAAQEPAPGGDGAAAAPRRDGQGAPAVRRGRLRVRPRRRGSANFFNVPAAV